MKIIESIMSQNPCYTSGKKITVKGLMLHSVGCPQPSAQVFINNWNKSSYSSACVHAFIDGNTGYVYKTLPWNHRGWHGGCSSNNTHIGVEMCESAYIKYTGGSSFTCSNLNAAQESAKKTYNAAVELFAFLCKEYGLDPLKKGVIVSHKEGYAMGIATNHGDPEHYWNGLKLSYTMNGFRNDVKNCMNGQGFITNTETPFNSLGKVINISNSEYLNLRQGPDTSYSSIGKYKLGDKVNIIAKSGDWYKLDNNGYVYSSYIQLCHWCDDIRDELLNKGIITDKSQWSLYSDVVTKGLAVKIISNVYGNEPKINNTHWASNAVENLYSHKIITDKSQWDDLDTPISKALLLALICNATGGVSDIYKNRQPDHWGRNCLDTLCDRAIISTPQSWVDFEAQVQKDILMALIYKSMNKFIK